MITLENLMNPKFLEILRLLKNGPIQASKLAKMVSFSESIFYDKLERLRKWGLVEEEAGFNEMGRPIKLYKLTPIGRKVLEKFEEVEEILNQLNCRS